MCGSCHVDIWRIILKCLFTFLFSAGSKNRTYCSPSCLMKCPNLEGAPKLNYPKYILQQHSKKSTILQGFEKFIRILVLQKTPKISQDVHVEHFWKRCDMCNLNYDIIGKMETFTKDSNYILENTGMNASKIDVEEKVDL